MYYTIRNNISYSANNLKNFLFLSESTHLKRNFCEKILRFEQNMIFLMIFKVFEICRRTQVKMTEKQGEIRRKLDLIQVSREFELDYPGSSRRGSNVASKNAQIKRVTVAGVLLESSV